MMRKNLFVKSYLVSEKGPNMIVRKGKVARNIVMIKSKVMGSKIVKGKNMKKAVTRINKTSLKQAMMRARKHKT